MIKHLKNGKSRLYTSDGSRPLGPPTSHAKAEAQERAIQARKHAAQMRPAHHAARRSGR